MSALHQHRLVVSTALQDCESDSDDGWSLVGAEVTPEQAAWLADLLNSVTASEPEEPLPELHPVQPIEDVMDVVLGEAHYYHPQPMYPPIALGGSSADSSTTPSPPHTPAPATLSPPSTPEKLDLPFRGTRLQNTMFDFVSL